MCSAPESFVCLTVSCHSGALVPEVIEAVNGLPPENFAGTASPVPAVGRIGENMKYGSRFGKPRNPYGSGHGIAGIAP